MKKTLAILATIGTLALTTTADASCYPPRLTGYTQCGIPIYSYFHLTGYTRCGDPIGHWDTQYPSSCRCRSHQSGYDRGYSSGRSGWSFYFRR